MNKFIKQVIEEKFASKSQQRFFYAQAGKKGKMGKKWSKWAKEFSDKTDFEKLPEKKGEEKEVEEIVDDKGNIQRGKKPTDFVTKGVTQDSITDVIVPMSAGSMGNHAFGQLGGGRYGVGTSLKYWAEGKVFTKKDILEVELDNMLGADDTILKDLPYDKAKNHMEKDLNVPSDEAKDRLEKMGYDEELEDGQIRLVENPKKFVEEYLESILNKKTNNNELVDKNDTEIKEINSIIKKQLNSLKNTMDNNNLSIDDILKYLKNDE
jgi:hypothetical protein